MFKTRNKSFNVNPLFNAGAVYLIFKILEGAFIRGRR